MDTITNDDTSTRFGLLEMDLDGKPSASQASTSEAPKGDAVTGVTIDVNALPAPQVKVVPGVSVDQEGVRRAMADEAAARAMGHSPKPPVYQLGTLVVEMGQQNFRKSRQEWDKMALLGDACKDLINRVQAEDRVDIPVDLPALHMLDDGRLQITGNGTYTVSERGIEGLAQFGAEGGGGYLNKCPAPLRAANLNHWFGMGYRVDKRATVKSNPEGTDFEDMTKTYTPTRVTVRTRKAEEGGRELFATVGPRYGNFDIDKVAAKVYGALHKLGAKDARCDVTYDGYKARFDVLFHSNVQPEKVVAGEIFKAGIVIRAADDGSGSINVSTEIWRNLCLNLIIIDHNKVLVGRRRHSGKAQDIADKLQEHLATADEKIKYFSEAWSHANTENILERYDLGNPRTVFEGLVLNGIVTAPGVKPDDMVNKLMTAWGHEEGYTKAAFINAITRMAHTESWRSWETPTELESTAGELLFAKVWNCEPPKAQTVADVLGGWDA